MTPRAPGGDAPQPSASTVSLSWIDPSTGEPQQRVLALPLTLGRAPDCAVVLASAVVSGRHAMLSADARGFVVEDTGSRNGVFHNGTRVARSVLSPGDTLSIGPFNILLHRDLSDVRVRLDWTDPASQRPMSAVMRLPVAIGSDPTNAVVVQDPNVLPRQVMIASDGNAVIIADASGAATIAVDGAWHARVAVQQGAMVQLGAWRIVATIDSAARRRSVGESTMVIADAQLAEVHQRLEARGPPWPPAEFAREHVSLESLAPLGLPIEEFDYTTVGAGLGSFIWVDNLAIRGVGAERIVALGTEPVPYARYRRLCRNSQIPDHERLRSNSESTADNPWGFPGYAAREITRELGRGRLGTALGILWQIFAEPALGETYTPIAADVFDGLDHEARRIGWERIVRYGRVRAIRKTADGRYVLAVSQMAERGSSRAFIVAKHLHIATGYPALRFLPDLQRYREDTGDFRSVVNAYEDHEHLYAHLQEHGGVMLLRGRGIVASRIIQRIDELRRVNPRVGLIHLNRTPLRQGHQWGRARRRVDHHFELQPFNWPKACWGGDLRARLENASPDERKRLLTDWGGTTTATRKDWLEIVARGVRDGWYQIAFGLVERVERSADGRVATIIRERGDGAAPERFVSDFVIDATGLDAKASTSPLLHDLIEHYHLALNPLERLDVTPAFEVSGLRNDPGRAFAAGAMTLGGPFAPVDSFLGFQYMAAVSLDHLSREGAPGLRRYGPARSVTQWLRWARGASP